MGLNMSLRGGSKKLVVLVLIVLVLIYAYHCLPIFLKENKILFIKTNNYNKDEVLKCKYPQE